MAQTLKLKVGKEGDNLGTFLTVGDLSKDQEPFPALALSKSYAFQTDSQVVEEASSDVPPFHNSLSTPVLVRQVDERENDADNEYPLGDIFVDHGRGIDLLLAAEEERDCGKSIGGIDSD